MRRERLLGASVLTRVDGHEVNHRTVAIVVALLAGVVMGYFGRAFLEAPHGARVGKVTYHAAKGSLVCVKAADQPRACGQWVQGTSGPALGDLRVGDQVKYRVAHKSIGGAQLVLIVAMA